jgi:hypothetical protein
LGALITVLGLAFMILANGAALLGSWKVLSRVRTGRASLDCTLFMLIRLLLISVAVLIAGVAGMLSASGLGIPAIVVLIALLVTSSKERFSRPILAAGTFPFVLLLGVIAVRLVLQAWFFSPHLGDALAYHLPKVAEWIRAGRFTHEMGVHPHVSFPAGFELLEAWWTVFLHHDALIELAGVECLALAGVACHALAEGVGLSPRSSLLAACGYVLTPGLHLSATSCLNDTPVAGLLVATFALVAGRVHPSLLLMTAGLGLGIKPTYGFALPGIFLLMILIRHEPPGLPPGRRAGFLLACGGLAAGAFWYVRNFLWFGSPFYPLGTPGFEDPTPVQFGPKWTSALLNIEALVNQRIYDYSAISGANVDDMAGWGSFAFACGLTGLVFCLRDERGIRTLAAGYGVSLLAALLFVQNDPWCLKYVFFFPSLLCIAAARLVERIPSILPFAWMLLGFSFLGTFFSYDLRLKQASVLASQPWRERSARVFPYGQIGNRLPAGEVGYFGSPTGAPYLLYGPDYSHRVVYLRSRTALELQEDLRAQNLLWVFAPSPTPEQQAILDESLRLGFFQPPEGRFYHVTRN